MPKTKKRKTPITQTFQGPSTGAQSCRKTIRKFHVLLKRRSQFERDVPKDKGAREVEQINSQITTLGGLEKYQEMSVLGQNNERGGGSEKVFILWMKELHLQGRYGEKKLELLEVGALKHDNYRSCQRWINCVSIDLHSRHPKILEQDFLKMNRIKNASSWDAISLSLVLNFVSTPDDRGQMLSMAHEFLRGDGLLFLALPLPCVSNSRYLTFDHLKALMASIGFNEVKAKWRPNGKMAYWLYQKGSVPSVAPSFSKKLVLRQGNRNNFAIAVHDSYAGRAIAMHGE